MQDQGLRSATADAFQQAGPADEGSGDLCLLSLDQNPTQQHTTPNLDDQIERESDANADGGEVGDVPAPELIRPAGLQPRHGEGLLLRPGTGQAMGLTMGMKHTIETAL